MRKGGYVMGWT